LTITLLIPLRAAAAFSVRESLTVGSRPRFVLAGRLDVGPEAKSSGVSHLGASGVRRSESPPPGPLVDEPRLRMASCAKSDGDASPLTRRSDADRGSFPRALHVVAVNGMPNCRAHRQVLGRFCFHGGFGAGRDEDALAAQVPRDQYSRVLFSRTGAGLGRSTPVAKTSALRPRPFSRWPAAPRSRRGRNDRDPPCAKTAPPPFCSLKTSGYQKRNFRHRPRLPPDCPSPSSSGDASTRIE